MPRQEERITHLEEVELEFASGKRLARISDISRGGCYVDTIATVPVGEPVSFRFTRPGAEQVQFRGTVAYLLEGFGFGIKFEELGPEAAEFLEALIAEKMPT